MSRRASYRSLDSLQRDNRGCRACADAGFPLASLPVVEGHAGQRAMIVGQAPGVVEGEQRRPWRGRAGATLRRWLELDEDEFYATFYCCSVTRCYPGRSPGGRGDRTPAAAEIELCRFWLDWERRLLRPALVLTVGGLAARRDARDRTPDGPGGNPPRARRGDRDPAAPPVRRERLAERTRASSVARAGARRCPRGARAPEALRPPGRCGRVAEAPADDLLLRNGVLRLRVAAVEPCPYGWLELDADGNLRL